MRETLTRQAGQDLQPVFACDLERRSLRELPWLEKLAMLDKLRERQLLFDKRIRERRKRSIWRHEVTGD